MGALRCARAGVSAPRRMRYPHLTACVHRKHHGGALLVLIAVYAILRFVIFAASWYAPPCTHVDDLCRREHAREGRREGGRERERGLPDVPVCPCRDSMHMYLFVGSVVVMYTCYSWILGHLVAGGNLDPSGGDPRGNAKPLTRIPKPLNIYSKPSNLNP